MGFVREPPLMPVSDGPLNVHIVRCAIDDESPLGRVSCQARGTLEARVIDRARHRSHQRLQSERIECGNIVFATVAAKIDEATDLPFRGALSEIERALLPKSRPKEGCSFGMFEACRRGQSHPLGHRRQRHRHSTARFWGERLEEGQNDRKRRSTQSTELVRSRFGLGVVLGDVRERFEAAVAHVAA